MKKQQQRGFGAVGETKSQDDEEYLKFLHIHGMTEGTGPCGDWVVDVPG